MEREGHLNLLWRGLALSKRAGEEVLRESARAALVAWMHRRPAPIGRRHPDELVQRSIFVRPPLECLVEDRPELGRREARWVGRLPLRGWPQAFSVPETRKGRYERELVLQGTSVED